MTRLFHTLAWLLVPLPLLGAFAFGLLTIGLPGTLFVWGCTALIFLWAGRGVYFRSSRP